MVESKIDSTIIQRMVLTWIEHQKRIINMLLIFITIQKKAERVLTLSTIFFTEVCKTELEFQFIVTMVLKREYGKDYRILSMRLCTCLLDTLTIKCFISIRV